jgi:hypothetical protein
MKKLFFLVLLPIVMYSQVLVTDAVPPASSSKLATLLDGSSQSWTKTTPALFDLNGAELIADANDVGFETNVGHWTDGGTHSITRSTTDKRTGTASGRIVSTGAGDTTTNFVNLPAVDFTTLITGNKYTIEVYARAGKATTTLTISLGKKSFTSGDISASGGTFTKVVYNFQCTATEVGFPLRLYLSQADTAFYIDDISITQSYDMIVGFDLKTTTTDDFATIILIGGTSAYGVRLTSPGLLQTMFYNPAISITYNSAATVNTNLWKKIFLVFDRTGNMSAYINGVLSGTPASIAGAGKMVTISPLAIGIRVSGGDRFCGGYFSDIRFTRFTALPADGGLSFIAQAQASGNNLLNFMDGTVVGSYDFKAGGSDNSGNGNNLSPGAAPLIVKVKK